MHKLKPSDHHTSLIYKCPSCEGEHFKTLNEVMYGQPVLACWCGHVCEIELITQPRFVATFAKSTRRTPLPMVVSEVEPSLVTEASSFIVAQGYTTKEANLYLKRAVQKHPSVESVAELVRYALAEVNHEQLETQHV